MTAFLPAAINAAAAVGSSILSRDKGKETKIQKQKRHLIDDLLNSLQGNGSFSGLFEGDYDSFQKSFVDPAKQLFNSQIAPQIQQSYIASGQQRGTGLDDTLTRAGVDLDQLLNQEFMKFQQGALDRKQNTINSILGSGDGAQPGVSVGQAAGLGASGFLSKQDNLGQDIFNFFNKNPSQPQRQGFAQ
jgi:hypothetical protein